MKNKPAPSQQERLAAIEERVNGHIKFFWAVASFFALWLVWVTHFLVAVNSKVDRIPSSISSALIQQSKSLADSGKVDDARRTLNFAGSLINSARAEKFKAPPNYFHKASSSLTGMISSPSYTQIHSAAFTTLLDLAGYRTTLETPPRTSGKVKTIETSVTDPAFWRGATVLMDIAHGDFFIPPLTRELSNNIVVEGPVVIGEVPDATQTLDGVHWVNTVFVNMKIRYEGGETELINVRFVDCTFDFSQGQRGVKIAYLVASSTPNSTIYQKIPS